MTSDDRGDDLGPTEEQMTGLAAGVPVSEPPTAERLDAEGAGGPASDETGDFQEPGTVGPSGEAQPDD